jgi:7,8-dihydropterin-6-yl-methyl-4-(beta-D-ribofuranosyl)aminobenzene 5'-phosphate synthase
MKRTSRRRFLGVSTKVGALLAVGDALPAGDSAPVRSKAVDVDEATVCVLTDNYYDALRPDTPIASRYRASPGRSIHAEHGLSCYVRTSLGGKTSACLFDFGLDAAGVINNMGLLGIDPGEAGALALSHGHFDHYLAALQVLHANRERIRKGTPIYVGPEAFQRRFVVRPGGRGPMDLGQLRRSDLEEPGLTVVEVTRPTEIVPGAYTTAAIERVTAYEKPAPSLLVERGGKLEVDDFPGEQALFFSVRNRGLVVLSGCAHAGIVNTVRQARKASGTERLLAVMGGFHLSGARPETIEQTVADIKAMDPEYVVPMHCTGFEATSAFAAEMPERFVLNTAGTHYSFRA